MQKKFPYGSEVIRFCLLIRVSIRPSPQKSAVTFDSLDGSARNFQGPFNSLQVIFGRVTRIPGPLGSGPGPEKGGFCQIYLLRGFWGRGWLVKVCILHQKMHVYLIIFHFSETKGSLSLTIIAPLLSKYP